MQWRFTSFVLGASIIAAGLFLAAQARASLIGDTVQGNSLAPTSTTIDHGLGTAVVGAGVEFTDLFTRIDFAASTVTFFAPNNAEFFSLPFNGYGFFDLTHAFTGATIDPSSTISGFSASDLSVSAAGELLVNLSGLTLSSGSILPEAHLTLDLSSAAVPEPGTLALFGGGLVGLMGLLLRRSRKPIAA